MLTRFWRTSKFWSLICKYVSSANRIVSKLVIVGRSLTYNKNKSGSSGDPRGIPQITFANSDISHQKFKYCSRSLKNFLSNSNGVPEMSSWVFNFCSKIIWFTVSKALDKSKKKCSNCISLRLQFLIRSHTNIHQTGKILCSPHSFNFLLLRRRSNLAYSNCK